MVTMYNPNPLAKNLTDAYQKRPESNNYKILEIERVACSDLRATLQEIDNILDINNARGKTLNLYGERVGQARGQAGDEKYLIMIKAKLARSLASGSYPSIANALCITFNCEPSQVLIVDGEEPCTVNVVSLPLAVINKADLTTSQTLAIIQSLLPAGVKVSSFLFEGTFEFSNTENEYDENAGFTDVEDGAIGGYFGVTSGDEKDIILPI